jgi:hypothetical protein
MVAVEYHHVRGDKKQMGKGRRGITPHAMRGCSTIELGRQIEPATGVEPITCDNPQLRPIKVLALSREQRARIDLDSTVALQIELLAPQREGGFEPPTYNVR